MGLQWAKHLRSAVKVTINDISEACVNMIKENCHLNHIQLEGGHTEDDDASINTVEVTQMDANVLMHLRAFDYMWVKSECHNANTEKDRMGHSILLHAQTASHNTK